MSFLPAGGWRTLVLAKRDRHLANKNQIAIFVFGVTARDFPHGALAHEKRASLFAKDIPRKTGALASIRAQSSGLPGSLNKAIRKGSTARYDHGKSASSGGQ